MSFGTRLAEVRKLKGMTQTQLGQGLGTDGTDASKAVVYGWEKDQHFPRVDQLALICQKLGTTASYLVHGAEVSGELSPEVADIASAINQLPKRQRDWVLSTVREAVSLAQETIGVNAKGVSGTTHASQNAEVSAPLRRKKTG